MIASNHIALEAIRLSKGKGFRVFMLSVFADDSSDEKGKRIFAIAGVMGTQEEWEALKILWLERTGGKIFHATDCDSDRGDFKDIPHEQNKKLYKDLTNLLAQTNMMGFGVALDVKSFMAFLPDALDDAPYINCFIRLISTFAGLASYVIPQQKIGFTFDINLKTKYNSALLYEHFLINHPEIKTSFMEDIIGYATSRTVGIQVADLFTRETMKVFDNRFGPHIRPVRLSARKLLETNRFKCYYYGEEYFKFLKDKIDEFKQNYVPKEHENYEKWLLQHGCQDNAESRTRFLIFLESMKDVDSLESFSS